MLEFINFKLYHSLGLSYPPRLSPEGDSAATGLMSVMHDVATGTRPLHNSTLHAGNTFAASLRTDICPQRKESSSTSHARNPFNLNFFDSAQCQMVRSWRLIGYFPILTFLIRLSV
jgi:hypothetical protein